MYEERRGCFIPPRLPDSPRVHTSLGRGGAPVLWGWSSSSGGKGPRLTHRPVVGDGVHAEGELLARVLQQLAPLGEGLGDHLALLDAFGLIITLPSQPEGTRDGGGEVEDSHLPSNPVKDQRSLSLQGRSLQRAPKSLEDSEE